MTEKALVGNASDAEQVKRAEKKEAFSRDRELEDIKQVLSTPAGRRFAYRYLEKSGVFRTSFSENTNVMLFREGERNFGLQLLAEINEADPQLYFKMVMESKEGK
jgi:hypothetical protein